MDEPPSFASDITYRDNMREGSQALLKALWDHHPAIMRRLFNQGKGVGRP